MSTDPACIFCRIVRGELPSARVLETDQALAILDINPVHAGHVLILPKSHHATLSELPPDLAAHIAAQLPRLCLRGARRPAPRDSTWSSTTAASPAK